MGRKFTSQFVAGYINRLDQAINFMSLLILIEIFLNLKAYFCKVEGTSFQCQDGFLSSTKNENDF